MKLLLLFIPLFLSNYTEAQIKLRGILEDASTREKIQFAHISFENSSIGTSSNADGYFELRYVELSKFDSVQISHISYQTKKLSIASLSFDTINSIILESNINILQEVLVLSKSPYEYLMNTLGEAKENIKHPFFSKYYYREIVKDNENYGKYSDAVLIANFPLDKEHMQVEVEEARVVNLPKESDDVLDIISPIDVSRILEFQYLNIFNRFFGEKKKYYDFQMKIDADNPKKITYEISPLVRPEKNTLLYYGWLITEDDNIKHVKIMSDTLCEWQKSMLGMTAKVTSFTVTLNFKEIYAIPILAQGVIKLEIDFIHKKFTQKNQYLSEFVALEVNEKALAKIEKHKLLKSKTIYKNGANYTTKFWEGNNIPIRTEEERRLLDRLIEHDQLKKPKKAK